MSAAEQPLADQLVEIIKQYRRRQAPKSTNLIDRVVHGIRSNVTPATANSVIITSSTSASIDTCNVHPSAANNSTGPVATNSNSTSSAVPSSIVTFNTWNFLIAKNNFLIPIGKQIKKKITQCRFMRWFWNRYKASASCLKCIQPCACLFLLKKKIDFSWGFWKNARRDGVRIKIEHTIEN